jgi:ABC-type multidrug transport system fused ATPase/permease subunit
LKACLARSSDHETDELIQNSLRTQVGKDVTVLIVAHRLRTIIDVDKIVRLSSPSKIDVDPKS